MILSGIYLWILLLLDILIPISYWKKLTDLTFLYDGAMDDALDPTCAHMIMVDLLSSDPFGIGIDFAI